MRSLKCCFSVWQIRILSMRQGGRKAASTTILFTVMPKTGHKNHIHFQDSNLAKDSIFFPFGVHTNQVIKQEVSVTKQYCKHTNQSLIPRELPPGAVMWNKWKNNPTYWALLMKNSLNSHLEMPPGNKTTSDPELPTLVCNTEAVWPKSCFTHLCLALFCHLCSACYLCLLYTGPG